MRYANPGENIKIAVRGIDDFNYVNKGDMLCSRDNECPVSEVFLANIQILNLDKHDIVCKGSHFVLHIHAAQEDCEIQEIRTAIIVDEDDNEEEVEQPKWIKSYA